MFCKSGSKSPKITESRLNMQRSPTRSINRLSKITYFCENHIEKRAQFVHNYSEENKHYFCEKCAIERASKGYAVNKISEK